MTFSAKVVDARVQIYAGFSQALFYFELCAAARCAACGAVWQNSASQRRTSRKHMEKLLAELRRLYLRSGAASPDALASHVRGETTLSASLTDASGQTSALLIEFHPQEGDEHAAHWTRLCDVANALQSELNLPAPGVSISGAQGYGLWMAFDPAVPSVQAQRFAALLRQAYFPAIDLAPASVAAPVEVPPFLHRASGLWAAFIHPGMGASFADEAGLDMMPPLAGQAAFLETLKTISATQFAHALDKLQHSHGDAVASARSIASVSAPSVDPASLQTPVTPASLLLKDATLEDIVRHLHALQIEPTFRHLIR